ncbi:MAG: hypothetical protein Kow0032_00480 [Methyloligellaceae bacterium]
MGEKAGAEAPAAAGQVPAAQVVERLMALSPVAQHWGMEVVDAARGSVTMAMRVRPDMANTHGACHGGVIFSLADLCFGFAANSYNERTAAAACEIKFLAPGKIGDRLTARSTELWRRGRSAYYDVRIENQDGELIALMRGQSRKIGGVHIEGEDG